jgi:cellulose synthase/poly-beta-1,6-N-acetylglucosamine synthase-like glycosyltransferase
MLSDILAVLAAAYACLILIFTGGAIASRFRPRQGYRPKVSVIVAARNEEERIGPCLESLIALVYPRELLEIIVIDDGSTDATSSIVSRYVEKNPHVRLLHSALESGHLRGKTNAVAQGIEAATGEIFMFTDADCRVPPGWVEGTVRHYADSRVGTVAGFTSLAGNDWFSRIQALDWFVLFSAAAGLARIGYPTTAVGTNLSVRREAYEKVGGYRKIPFSVTEDYALFHAVTRTGGYRACFPMIRETLVESAPCATAKELYQQKKRWFAGGRGMDLKSMLVFAIPYVFNLALIVALVALPWSEFFWALGVKLGVDFLFCLPSVIRFRRPGLLPVFPLYALYYYMYVLIYPPLVLPGGKIVWKERTFGKQKA